MSHPVTPSPRPALRKAADGTVHPASPVLSSLAVTVVPGPGGPGEPEEPDERTKPGKKSAKKGAKGKASDSEEIVVLQVDLPKPVRKALRTRAAEYGWTAEEAASQVLRVWADH